MNAINGSHGNDTNDSTAIQNERICLRSYQAEMVEESLRANIIVVMDTGSGKTHMYLHLLNIGLALFDHYPVRSHAQPQN